MSLGIPSPHGVSRCAGDDDVSPGNGQSSASEAERIASRTARATWGWQDAEWARDAGFGRRERRRRRCGGNGGHQASAASHPSGVNRGLLGRTRPRRGQRLFTCKRRDAREASLPLRCYAESREGPGLHRQPRPGDRRCVGRPPSASVAAGRTETRPARRGGRARARVSNRVSGCGVHGSPVQGRCHTCRAGRQGRLWHCVSVSSIPHVEGESKAGRKGWRRWADSGGESQKAAGKSQKWAAAAARSYTGRRAFRRAHRARVGGAAAQAGCEHSVDVPVRT
jgi:hypothetical protein